MKEEKSQVRRKKVEENSGEWRESRQVERKMQVNGKKNTGNGERNIGEWREKYRN